MTTQPVPADQPPEILLAREVADILRCSDQQVYNLARAGKIPSIRIGKLVRFRRSEILAMQQSQSAEEES